MNPDLEALKMTYAHLEDTRMLEFFTSIEEADELVEAKRAELTESGEYTEQGIEERMMDYQSELRTKLWEKFATTAEQRAKHYAEQVAKLAPDPVEPLPDEQQNRVIDALRGLKPSQKKQLLLNLHRPENADFAVVIATESPYLTGVPEPVVERARSILNGRMIVALQNEAARIKNPNHVTNDPLLIAIEKMQLLEKTRTTFAYTLGAAR